MNKSEVRQGLRDSLPIMTAVVFFGALFGATAVNNGLSFWQTIAASAAIFAGASQFVFLDLFNQKVPVWSVMLTVFAVNFRHVLYSAAITRHLGLFGSLQKYASFFLLTDISFGASEQRAERNALTPSYYFGLAIPFYPIWVVSTLVGALAGGLITDPMALGLDMLLSLYFLSLLIGFRARPNWLTVVLASGAVAVVVDRTIGSPWHILCGSLAGILLAAFLGKPKNRADRSSGTVEQGQEQGA